MAQLEGELAALRMRPWWRRLARRKRQPNSNFDANGFRLKRSGVAEFLARLSEGLPNSGKRWAYRDARGCFPRQIFGTPGYETWSAGHATQFDGG